MNMDGLLYLLNVTGNALAAAEMEIASLRQRVADLEARGAEKEEKT